MKAKQACTVEVPVEPRLRQLLRIEFRNLVDATWPRTAGEVRGSGWANVGLEQIEDVLLDGDCERD
jgi:hypothetical protein